MYTLDQLTAGPNALADKYRRFRVAERLLLTGHSHQAWPDCAFDAHCRAWLDAAELADAKWERAFGEADRVRAGFARLLGDGSGHVTLAPNTHDLVVRFLSALPLAKRPRLVTTDGEFHSIRRQLDRLAEERIDVVKVAAAPAATTAERLAAAVDARTAAVLVSSVLFESARIVPGLGDLATACRKAGAELLVDTYHHLNVVPFAIEEEGLEDAFLVGGGYKYCQLGEGNCFLRTPPSCALRPVITGWFSEFETLGKRPEGGLVAYGRGPLRFAGSTFDPTSHYRGAAVFDFFTAEGLDPAFLRAVSRHQVGLLARAFDALDLDPGVVTRDHEVPLPEIGGFLTLESPRAGELVAALAKRGVLTDARGKHLRFGPAPYLSDRQLEDAMAALAEVCSDLDR